MSPMGWLTTVSWAALLLPAAPAAAEKGQWLLSVTPGIAVPVGTSGSFQEKHGNSLHILAGVNYEVDDGYWFGAEIGYSGGHQFEGKLNGTDFDGDGTTDPVDFTSDMDTTMLYVSPLLKIGGIVGPEMKYSFLVGPGLYTFYRGAGSAILLGHTTKGVSVAGRTVPMAKSLNSYAGFNLGHTIGIGVTESFELDLDVRYHVIFMPGGGTGIVVPGLRFAYQF